MAFLMSRLSAFGGPEMPPAFPLEARRGGWPRPIDRDLYSLTGISEDEFRMLFQRSPVKRAKYGMISQE